MKRLIIVVLILCLKLVWLSFVFWQGGAGQHIAEAAKDMEGPVECDGDKVEYFEEEKKVVGTGNVVITHKDSTLTCDKVTLWTESKEARAEGNAKLIRAEGILEGERIEYNFEKNTGKISGDIKAKFPPWYARGKEAEKVSQDKYIVRKGYITTCDHQRPHWKLSANRAEIYPDVMVTTYNAMAWFNPFPDAMGWDIPAMWVPYYCHPLDDDKPHVVLIPGKYKDWGYYLLTAWRYHLTPNQKGYFHLDYRENKDVATGMDYIYDSQIFGKGNVKTYYMNERDAKLKHNYHRYTKKKWRDVWRHESDYAWKPTTELEKGLLRIRHQWQMTPNTQLTAEMHKYKDKDFLKDYFFNEYEKDVSPETYLLVTNTAEFYNLSLYANKRMNRFNSVGEHLPEVTFNINNISIFKKEEQSNQEQYAEERSRGEKFNLGNFYYTGSLKAVNLHQVYPRHTDDDPGRITDPQHNNIYDAYSKLSYESKLAFLGVTPYVGTKQTYFEREISGDTSQTRGVFYTGVDVSTKFFKIFYTRCSPLGMEIDNLRHIITPTLSYNYIPPPTMPSGKVFGDGVDRSSLMSLGLENKLQTKRGEDLHTVDLAMLLVTTSYDFQHTPGTQFSDYQAKLELKPFDWLTATSNGIMDPHKRYHHQWLKQLDNDISISITDKWSFGLGHRYTQGSNSMVLQGKFNTIPGWKFDIYEEMDILATRQGGKKKWDLKEQQYVINTDLHCWDMEVRYNIDRDMGEELMVIFRLKAFPDVPFEFGKQYHLPKVGSQSYQSNN